MNQLNYLYICWYTRDLYVKTKYNIYLNGELNGKRTIVGYYKELPGFLWCLRKRDLKEINEEDNGLKFLIYWVFEIFLILSLTKDFTCNNIYVGLNQIFAHWKINSSVFLRVFASIIHILNLTYGYDTFFTDRIYSMLKGKNISSINSIRVIWNSFEHIYKFFKLKSPMNN